MLKCIRSVQTQLSIFINMKEILEIQPHKHMEPFWNHFLTVLMYPYGNKHDEHICWIFQVQDKSQFVRNSLRFRYCKVWTNIQSLYRAHLMNGSFLEKPSNFFIKNIGGFGRDGRVVLSNPLLRSLFVPEWFVTIPEYINMPLTSANCPLTVLRLS